MFEIKVTEIFETKNTNCGSFLQTPFWCEFKANHGWKYKRFSLQIKYPNLQIETSDCKHNPTNENTEEKSFEVSVLSRSFAKGFFSISYIPLFPELPYKCTNPELLDKAFENDEVGIIQEEIVTAETQSIEFANLLQDLAFALKPYLPKNTIAIRFDPNVSFTDIEDRDLFNYGIKTVAFADRLKLKKNFVDIQPPDTSIINLTATEEEILSKMHSKWRYNIRLSEKKGVVIHKYTRNDINLSKKIDKFYELTKETNARDGNASHSKSYYLDLISRSAKNLEKEVDSPLITLYIAEHEGDEIASIMTLFSKDEAIYLYGASSNYKRNLMPHHLLQWTAIKDAKQYGSKCYDFYGMSPEGKDEKHPMHGLYLFKSNFGGQNIHRTGSWDVPTKWIYFPYSFAEKLRAFWYKKIKKMMKKSVKKDCRIKCDNDTKLTNPHNDTKLTNPHNDTKLHRDDKSPQVIARSEATKQSIISEFFAGKIPCFGVAGNFTGHLEQAGEAVDFANVKTAEANAPKAIFPTYIPVKSSKKQNIQNDKITETSQIPENLLDFPFDENKIIFPKNEENIQVEPECALIFDATWENQKLKQLKPICFGASNDCSIRKPGAKKISEKKNWGKSSKGFSTNLISIDTFSKGSILDNYNIASFIKRNGSVFEYGEDSAIKDYSYIYEKLLTWLVEKINNQQNEGPAEKIFDYLAQADYPSKIMISIGATRYTDFGEKNYLQKGDISYIIIYPKKNYSKEVLIEKIKKDEPFEKDISSLIQEVVL